jgi:hypothetical protein
VKFFDVPPAHGSARQIEHENGGLAVFRDLSQWRELV